MNALEVTNLRITSSTATLVDGLNLTVGAGEVVALVGESGAGKSLTARALLGLLPAGIRSSVDQLTVDGHDASGFNEREWRRMRGARIALVSQDALVALDPLNRVGTEVAEPLRLHQKLTAPARAKRVQELLTSVAIPQPLRRARQYPHELSGGLRQRALIASALAASPRVIVADEPTTALDATVQARVLDLLRDIADGGCAVLLVSHDLGAVRRIADRIVVMRAGQIVETGSAQQILTHPVEAYTRQLLAAATPAPRAVSQPTTPLMIDVQRVSKAFDTPAVDNVSFTVARGRTLGVVGESGSGKTTLARMLVGVETPDSGEIFINEAAWGTPAARSQGLRQKVQLIHQNPYGALDPRWRIRRSLSEALAARGVARSDRPTAVLALLAEVGLDAALAHRRPAELSGGQRQRVVIARALAMQPEVLVLDEPVSALDPTVRSATLELLNTLQIDRGLTMVFVSHDLGVVAAVADEIIVMQDGVVVESGTTATVLTNPQHPFTKELVASASSPPT